MKNEGKGIKKAAGSTIAAVVHLLFRKDVSLCLWEMVYTEIKTASTRLYTGKSRLCLTAPS